MQFLSYLINGISLGSVYALIALGYTMVYGIAKMLNFAHGDVIMIGSYVIFFAFGSFGLNPIVSVLLSIGYGSRPRLRSRLTQSRSALLWKPWIFGREDSHLSLATHSGILSSYPSTAPSGTASSVLRMLLYQLPEQFHGFGGVFQPRTFSAQGLSTSELLRTL